jgi:hypothetical protein
LKIGLREAVQKGLALIFRDSFFIPRDLPGGIENHWLAAPMATSASGRAPEPLNVYIVGCH